MKLKLILVLVVVSYIQMKAEQRYAQQFYLADSTQRPTQLKMTRHLEIEEDRTPGAGDPIGGPYPDVQM